MKPDDPLKLVGQLIDLPILDKDDRWSGIVDDVELSGGAGKAIRIDALLVGPGAYKGRMPAWMFWLVGKVAGERMTRVPFGEVADIGAVVKLKSGAEALGLHRTEDKVRAWIPRRGAF